MKRLALAFLFAAHGASAQVVRPSGPAKLVPALGSAGAAPAPSLSLAPSSLATLALPASAVPAPPVAPAPSADAPAPAGMPVAALLTDHRAAAADASGKKLNFTGTLGRDVYNPTAPFSVMFDGRAVKVLAGRVEARDSEASEVVFFQKKSDGWRPLPGAPVLALQDPFTTTIDGELIFGGVETFPKDGGLGYRTVFYRGRSLETLKRFAQGPDGMKDIRLSKLPDGKILVVTRPQGAIGGRGKIAVTTIDDLAALNPAAIEKAVLVDGLFADGEWGGANELHALRNGLVGVLGHVARFDERGNRHYYPMAFALDPATGKRSPMKLLLERARLPAGASKRPDLEDVLFSGGLIRGKSGRASLFVGAGDAEAYRVEIVDPFVGLDGGAAGFTRSDKQFLDEVQRKAFLYFMEQTDPKTGLTKDRAGNFGGGDRGIASMAATGFGLTALTVGQSRGWISRKQGYHRALTTLRHLRSRQAHDHGWFHHFVDAATGKPAPGSEISSIDTALLLAGVLTAGEHFKGTEVERLAREIYERVDFPWMMTDGGASPESLTLSMGKTDKGFIPARWNAYSEHHILYMLGLGSPAHPLPAASWRAWKRPDNGPLTEASSALFTHQYSQLWLDLRGWNDEGHDYFAKSVEATLAHRAAAIAARGEHPAYGPDCWGWTSCDGPDGYRPYGAAPSGREHDGTIAPAAAGGSMAHTPQLSLSALRYMRKTYGDRIWGRYGFADAFNAGRKWRSPDAVGIDQGAILLAIENARSGGVWKTFMRTKAARRAFEKLAPR